MASTRATRGSTGAPALVSRSSSGRQLAPRPNAEKWPLDFADVYEQWFDEVSRWIRAMGGPAADKEDLAQDVFIVVHRRLPDFDGENLPGWLYQIARNRVRDFRRLSAIKYIFSRAIPLVGGGPQDHAASPEESLATREKRALLEHLLDQLSEVERSALVLFELEGYNGEQIAALHNAPINTIWARIHKARLKLHKKLASNQKREALPPLRRA